MGLQALSGTQAGHRRQGEGVLCRRSLQPVPGKPRAGSPHTLDPSLPNCQGGDRHVSLPLGAPDFWGLDVTPLLLGTQMTVFSVGWGRGRL